MNLKMIVALLLVLFLISVALADARSGGRGGRSGGSYSKSFSSKISSPLSEGSAKVVGATALAATTKGTKKRIHLDDDFLENESANETDADAEKIPGLEALYALLAVGLLGLALRRFRNQA